MSMKHFDYKTLDIAPYLPSMQTNYTQFDLNYKRQLPSPLSNADLNFISGKSKLWNCDYALYSSGRLDSAQILRHDMIAHRDERTGVIVGDSGGFQLGTGVIANKDEREHLVRFEDNPQAQFDNWQHCGFRERTLRWLEKYTDYAMTLDMVLWTNQTINPNSKSQIRNLSIQQLIDLSVDNLRYFSDNRGKAGKSTKFLSVLQDVGNGTGEAWYQAVKDFEFEGWALGSETKDRMADVVVWLKRLLNEGKLDKAEWIHVLAASPIINQVLLTAVQRALSKQLNRNLTISLDSSSPMQLAGVNKKLCGLTDLTDNLGDWRIPTNTLEQTVKIARREIAAPLPSYSPFAKYCDYADIVVNKDWYADNRTDTLSEIMLVNHNIYMFHLNGIRATQLALDGIGEGTVPTLLADAIGAIENYFASENEKQSEAEMLELLGQFKVMG